MVDWLPDELTLMGDAMRLNGWNAIRANTPAARDLSSLLSRGQLHPQRTFPPDFRSQNSIQRKSYDLYSASETYEGTRTRGGRLARGLYDKFRADEDALAERAEAIRRILSTLPDRSVLQETAEEPDEVIAAHEGGIVEVLVRRRERDRSLRKAKIKQVLAGGRAIACEACGFDFAATYGTRGKDYIEVHHVRPLHVTGPTATQLSDLALVCANCHRMCHRGDWISPAALARMIRTTQ